MRMKRGTWKQDESGRVCTPFEPLVLVATLALVPVLIIEADTKSDSASRNVRRARLSRDGAFSGRIRTSEHRRDAAA